MKQRIIFITIFIMAAVVFCYLLVILGDIHQSSRSSIVFSKEKIKHWVKHWDELDILVVKRYYQPYTVEEMKTTAILQETSSGCVHISA